jgi:hypothetical protein
MMRGSSAPKPLKKGRIFLILLYALTFYFGPQIGGGKPDLHEGNLSANEVNGSSTGFYSMNEFNDRFELNDL